MTEKTSDLIANAVSSVVCAHFLSFNGFALVGWKISYLIDSRRRHLPHPPKSSVLSLKIEEGRFCTSMFPDDITL